MVDRPILFSAAMIRAILREIEKPGTGKTQTRRILSPATTLFNGMPWDKAAKAQTWDWERAWVDAGPSPAGNPGPYLKLPWAAGDSDRWEHTVHRVYPRWTPGDKIWVREAWRSAAPLDDTPPRDMDDLLFPPVRYEAGGAVVNWTEWRGHDVGRLRTGIHMPRWASRITLIVTDVRVQRLLDITNEDAEAEGFSEGPLGDPMPETDIGNGWTISSPGGWASAAGHFQVYWSELHPDWDGFSSPWVVAITFRPILANIDSVEARAA